MIDFFYDSYHMFFQFLIPGIFLGMIYDFFRLIRIARNDQSFCLLQEIRKRYFQKNETAESFQEKYRKNLFETLFVFMEDVLFFLIVATTEILAIYHLNNGEIRISCLVFSAIGFLAYQQTVGRLIIFLSRKILYGFRRVLYFLVSLILVPTFFFLKKLSHSKNKKQRIVTE